MNICAIGLFKTPDLFYKLFTYIFGELRRPGKNLAEVFFQREQKHILNRLVLELMGIKLASSLGLSDMGPVGCTVAGPTESVLR